MQLGQWCLLAGIIEVRILLSHRDWETEALSSGVLRRWLEQTVKIFGSLFSGRHFGGGGVRATLGRQP